MNQAFPFNSVISHYRIVSKLGAGGMGEVYLAEDTKLDRKVALKVLPHDVASNHDRMDRFIREAKSAAALSHPNIAQIFEIGEHDGTHFIAMEFIDGVTLRQTIHREQLELGKMLRHLQHVAEGLAKAHSAGIIHRDLKPDNIMITRDGHAKILDFGLAKLIDQQTTPGFESSQVATAVLAHQSLPGTVIGTVGYMSPEQAQGKTKKIDHRSDIFSFGCILFEAVTGQKAFAGEDVIDSLNRIIRESPPPITELRPDAPNHLQRIVRRCLAKDPDDRYQTIKDVAIELRDLRRELANSLTIDSTVPPSNIEAPASTVSGPAIQTTPSVSIPPTVSSAEYLVSQIGSHRRGLAVALGLVLLLAAGLMYWFLKDRGTVPAGSMASIAVLPFQNRSDDPDTDYLSDGLAESLIFRLSQIPGLKVSPTSSVMRYKGSEADVSKIASELGVDAVMTGRLMKRGDNLNITVELVDARNNKSLWGEQYERRMSDLLATQREIAGVIVQKLQLKLSGDEEGVTKKYTDNNEAYQLYLKGRFHFARRTKVDMERSVELLQQATALDPNFALAYVGIAESYTSMTSYPYLSPQAAYPKAKAAIAKALEHDPELPEAHAVAGMIAATDEWDYAKAEREFKRALELGPNLAITHYRYGWTYLSTVGRHDEAVSEMKRAMELEPLSVQQGANYASVLMYARRFDEAVEQARKTYELDPNHVSGRNWLCHTLNAKGLHREALEIAEAAFQADPTRLNLLSACLGVAYAKTGQREKALETIARVKEAAKTRYVMTYWVAVQYAVLGDKDAAFAELETSFQNRDWFLPRLKVDPFMDQLRDDPRFDALVKRLNLPQ